jgi:3-methyladenine DNA glycosylase/8-oxoguanine DNA glycosylase
LPPWDQKILSRLIYNKALVPAKKILKDAEKRWGKWKRLAIHYIWEDIFWQRKQGEKIPWLEKEIRL